MKSVYKNKENCCGCTACQHICPTKAIQMKADEEGFLYPEIDQSLCIDCGLCRKVCAFQNGYDKSQNLKKIKLYAVKNIDEKVRISSTSGGLFTAASDNILDKGGIVFGAAFDRDFNVVHTIAFNKKDRDELKGSKYVQSDLRNVFQEIREFLDKKKLVLFTGTPCQNAGLKRYLIETKTNTKNLYLCDILCYGVPSPLLWLEYVEFLQKNENSKINKFYFRPKIKGWHNHTQMAIFENGKIDYSSALSQTFKILFQSNYILRPSCYACKFTNFIRPSDITIGDFWGIEKSMPEFDDDKGISLLIINTSKGQSLFKEISNNLVFKISNKKECRQSRLYQSAKLPIHREKFWKEYNLYGYRYIAALYGENNLKGIIKNLIRKHFSNLKLFKYIKNVRRQLF